MEKIRKATLQPNQNINVTTNRPHLEWIPIQDVIPNPLNPRKDFTVKSAELQRLIKTRGWEVPLTAYKKNNMYILLAGHRRLYAARQFGAKELPVYVVSAPKTTAEELERLADAQAGQEDWTTWEWANYYYDRWLGFGRPSFAKFSALVDKPERTMKGYCQVLEYFPKDEIESAVKRQAISVSLLYDAYLWLRLVKQQHPDLVDLLSEDLMRRVMVNKIENKKAPAEALRRREYLKVASVEDLREFFVNPEMSLEETMARSKYNINEKSFHGHMISMAAQRRSLKGFVPKNPIEAEKAVDSIKSLIETARTQLQYIEKQYPDAMKKEDLFNWGKGQK
jgi:ParB family chromosome partitioning protein